MMINGVNPNEDILQKGARATIGMYPATRTNGKDYAHYVNVKARDRLAAYRRGARIMDSIQAINRVKWANLPTGLRSNLMERVLYYKGQGMYYFDETLNQYFFLPFAMTSKDNETIDFYGQYQWVKPLPFNGRSDRDKASDLEKARLVYLGNVVRHPIYDMDTLKEIIETKGKEWAKLNCCIICYDYTQQLSQYIEPKSITQECWINAQAEIPLFFRTAMLKALMPTLVRTSDQGTMDVVIEELQSVEDSILEGKTMIPVTAFQEMQTVEGGSNLGKLIEETTKAYETINNIRKSHLGLPNDGAFKKKAQVLQAENEVNETSNDVILADAIWNRNYFSDMVNVLFDQQIYANAGDGIDETHSQKAEDEESAEMEKMDAEDGKEEGLTNA